MTISEIQLKLSQDRLAAAERQIPGGLLHVLSDEQGEVKIQLKLGVSALEFDFKPTMRNAMNPWRVTFVACTDADCPESHGRYPLGALPQNDLAEALWRLVNVFRLDRELREAGK